MPTPTLQRDLAGLAGRVPISGQRASLERVATPPGPFRWQGKKAMPTRVTRPPAIGGPIKVTGGSGLDPTYHSASHEAGGHGVGLPMPAVVRDELSHAREDIAAKSRVAGREQSARDGRGGRPEQGVIRRLDSCVVGGLSLVSGLSVAKADTPRQLSPTPLRCADTADPPQGREPASCVRIVGGRVVPPPRPPAIPLSMSPPSPGSSPGRIASGGIRLNGARP